MPVGVRIEEGSVVPVQSSTAVATEADEPDTTTLTAAAVEIFPANPDRGGVIIRNTHDTERARLGYNANITAANAPIDLGPGDHHIETVWQGAIYGTRAGSVNVVVAHQQVSKP